jgi:tetratricopeptide (TPR) repeat protein
VARAILAASLARNPGSAALHEAAGLAALDARDHDAACASLLEALRLAPGRAETQANLAEALAGAGRHDEAVRLLDAAIPRLADPALARLNRAHALMALGRWAEAWIDYEARLGRASMAGAARHPARIPLPAWRGGPAPAGPLLVWGEQGLGDEIVGASLLPALAAQVEDIVVEASPRLAALLARSLPDMRVVARDDAAIPPGCVAHVPMGSLMGILGWTPARLPMAPVLVADRARAAAAAARHRRPGRRLVGLAWASGAGGGLGALKTLPRGELERLVAGSGDVFLDLQYGDTEQTRAELAAATGAEILRDREIDVRSDIDGLAALCAACDAVVTTSNVTAHVAGALGAETHVLVPSGHGQLWYWTPSPGAAAFYARATLHRQDGASWRGAVDSVRAALAVRPPTR